MRDARLNAAELILAAAREKPDAVAVRLRSDAEQRDVSYGELRRDVTRFASALAALGIAEGERVLLVLPDVPELPTAFLGAMWRGAVPVLVNPNLRADDYRFFADDTAAPAVVTTAQLADVFTATADVRTVLTVGPRRSGTLWDALATAADGRAAAATGGDDQAFWLYSSGTTGKPKGTIHRHANVLACIDGYDAAVLGTTARDVAYSTSKAFFAYGLGASIVFPLAAGATVVLAPDAFQPARSWAILERERPTLFFSVPSVYRTLLDGPCADPRATLAGVRRCLSAGEALPAGLFEAWREHTGHEILDGIGATEMLHIFLSNFPGEARPGTLARVVPGYEVKIVDEHGEPVSDGEPGVMLVRGGSMAAGYWRRPEPTRRAFRGEWYVTGDRAVRDAAGAFRIVGRADDLMKVAGQWVAPGDVEDVIAAVDGVRDCAVVGRPGADGLLELVAFVVTDAGAEALVGAVHEHCAARLPRFKRPREVRVIDALPRTPTGKLQRFRLSELARSAMLLRPPP